MQTVKITINGRELNVEKGKTVLQAALENGVELPITAITPGSAWTAPAASASPAPGFIKLKPIE